MGVLHMCWSGRIWNVVWLLLTIQLVGLFKAAFAALLSGRLHLLFLTSYSMLYMTSLLPAKYFAMARITNKSWGTSGRNNLLNNYSGAIPLAVWFLLTLGGLTYTIITDIHTGFTHKEALYLLYGFGGYAGQW